MGSYYRDGTDQMQCVECNESFDLNNPERRTIHPGARFQPYCLRHLRQSLSDKYGDASEATCVVCGATRETEDLGLVNHMHPTGEVDPVFVCSYDCTLNQLKTGSTWRWHGEGAEFEETTIEESQQARAIAGRTIEYINEHYRCTATLLPSLVDMRTFQFTIHVEHPYQAVDEPFVERFDRIGFETEFGRCTLKLIDYAAFGICKFDYDLSNTE